MRMLASFLLFSGITLALAVLPSTQADAWSYVCEAETMRDGTDSTDLSALSESSPAEISLAICSDTGSDSHELTFQGFAGCSGVTFLRKHTESYSSPMIDLAFHYSSRFTGDVQTTICVQAWRIPRGPSVTGETALTEPIYTSGYFWRIDQDWRQVETVDESCHTFQDDGSSRYFAYWGQARQTDPRDFAFKVSVSTSACGTVDLSFTLAKTTWQHHWE